MKNGLVLIILLSLAMGGAAAKPPERDRDVQAVVNAVSAQRLEQTVRALAAFPTRHTLSGTGNIEAAARWIEREFEGVARGSGGRLQVVRDTWMQPAGNRLPRPHPMTNIYAVLPGAATPERVIVVSGHYDSRASNVMDAQTPAPGANDDASGVAVVLELARLMASRRYEATVIFAAVTGEEQGLYGATHLAERLEKEKRTVLAMITNDIVGNSRGQNGKKEDRTVRLFSAGYDPTETVGQIAQRRSAGTDADSPARTLARAVRDAARRYVKNFDVTLVYRNDRYLRGGDHTPFLQRGVAAVRLTEPNEDWRHQHQDVRTENGVRYGDLPEFVDYAYLARVAQVNAAVVASLAAAPAPPGRVTLWADLSPVTRLTWTAAGDGRAHEVLWRATTAPDWEGARLVETGKGVMLPLSKDDTLFAVRSVSTSGARSLPVVPIPAR